MLDRKKVDENVQASSKMQSVLKFFVKQYSVMGWKILLLDGTDCYRTGIVYNDLHNSYYFKLIYIFQKKIK